MIKKDLLGRLWCVLSEKEANHFGSLFHPKTIKLRIKIAKFNGGGYLFNNSSCDYFLASSLKDLI